MFNFKKYQYAPCFKSKDGELGAFENLSPEVTQQLLPIIELTKGRKTRIDKIGLIKKRIDKIYNIFKENYFILDITSQPEQQNTELESLLNPNNGFAEWVNFIKEEIKIKRKFKVIPIVHISGDESLYDDIICQIVNLFKEVKYIAIRVFFRDFINLTQMLQYIAEEFTDNLDSIILIIDNEYIHPRFFLSLIDATLGFTRNMRNYGYKNIIIVSSSYPSSLVQSCGDDYHGNLEQEEKKFVDKIQSNISNCNILYGDYASIHPIVSDQIRFRPLPRIDFIANNKYIYYRRRHPISHNAYMETAQAVVVDSNFADVPNCWGKEKINDAADGKVFARNAVGWISVRMNIHITSVIEQI